MLSKSESEWMKSSILDLPFSVDFKIMANNNKLKKLGDVVDTEIADLLKLPGFSYHCLQEFVQFLEERELAKLIKHG